MPKVNNNPEKRHQNMNLNKTIASIVITSILLSLPAIADTNNDSKVEEIISITDLLRSHTEGEPASFSVQHVIWSPDGSKLLVRYTDSPSQSEQMDDLYVMNADGTELNKIASSKCIKSEGAWISWPMWSPTGDKIAFHLSQPRGALLAVINPDGTGLNAIGTDLSDMESILSSVPDFGSQRRLRWSPDGAKMAFEWENAKTYIYVADADGSNPVKLYPDAPNSNPVWGHDSKKIAFRTKSSLMSANVNGTGLTYLSNGTDGTKYGIKHLRYSWSPDDSKLLYMASIKEVDGKEQFGIFVVNADGTKRVEIMRGVYFENTHWSSDGCKILFALGVGEEGQELYTVDTDGRNLILLSKGHISGASWSPDGSRIAFMKDHSLYTMNSDSTGKMMLALAGRGVADATYAWNPSGDKIAFSSVVDLKTGKEISLDAASQDWGAYESPIFMSNPDGTKRVQLMQGGYNTLESWSPDGSRLLVRSRDETGYLRNTVIIKLSDVTPISIKPTPKPLETASTQPGVKQTPEETGTAVMETTAPATDTVETPGFTAILSVIGLIVSIFYISKYMRGV